MVATLGRMAQASQALEPMKRDPLGPILMALILVVLALVMVNTLLPDMWWQYVRGR